jgi:radical SAM protein with 4Fe4S-binding SPASM domain
MNCFFTDNAITIFPDGTIVPCCRFSHKSVNQLENIDTVSSIVDVKDSPTFSKVREDLDKNFWSAGCNRCKYDEELKIRSRRQIYNTKYNEGKLRRLADVAIGNFCNLKCIMCNSQYSTQWHKDQEYLLKNGIGEKHYNPPSKFFNRLLSNEAIDKLVAWIESDDTPVDVEIKGGEPLALPNSRNLFERLASVKNSITVVVTTNGTFLPEWFKDVCKNLRIRLSVSIDGVDEVYDYVRGTDNYTFDLFDNNVRLFKELPLDDFNFNYVVQNVNVHHLKTCIDRYQDHVSVIFLRNPVWLQVWNMPEKSKKHIFRELKSIPSTYKQYHKIASVIKNIKNPCNQDEYDQFIKFTALLDKQRNKSLPNIASHLFTKESLEKYNAVLHGTV